MSRYLLEVKNLVKHFPVDKTSAVHAVDDVDFYVEEGETLGLVGESGCGKSTVGRMLVRLIEPTSGDISFRGENILAYDRSKLFGMRKKMQIVFQDPFSSLDPRKSVAQIVAEPLRIHRYGSEKEIREKTIQLLESVGLSEMEAGLYQHEMDGGRCQRVGIARALALNPEFIVCDEPVSALDVSVQAQILNLLKEIQARFNLSYIFISHNLAVVKHMCSRVMVMYLGKVLEVAENEELFSRPLHPYTQALLAAVPTLDLAGAQNRVILSGDVPTPVNPAPGCRFLKRCSHAIDRCASGMPPLEALDEKEHYVACFRWREIAHEA